jgi:hypothetical protein
MDGFSIEFWGAESQSDFLDCRNNCPSGVGFNRIVEWLGGEAAEAKFRRVAW